MRYDYILRAKIYFKEWPLIDTFLAAGFSNSPVHCGVPTLWVLLSVNIWLRLAVVRFSSGSGTFWLNLNLKYQVQSSRQPNPGPEPLEPGLKGSNSVWTSLNLQLNKPNFSFFYLFFFSVFSWCHTVTEPNWLAYIFISSQPTLSFHSHSHTTSKVIVFITN